MLNHPIARFILLTSLALGGCEFESDAAEEFSERATGRWGTVLQIGEAEAAVFATDIYTFSGAQQTIVAEAFFDPELTTPFLRYEAHLSVEGIARSETIDDGFEIDLSTDYATMEALVDDPALFAAFGLDDCGLVFGEAVDVSNSDCGVPLFRDASCVEMDLYQVAEDSDEFRVGVITDKCVERPAVINAEQVFMRLSD